MAGVNNKTARQFNLKAITNGKHVTVRLKPGFNTVNDSAWDHMKGCEYVKSLKEQGLIDFGKAQDDKELDADSSQEAITSVKKAPEKKKETKK